jgi:hypothetical protein
LRIFQIFLVIILFFRKVKSIYRKVLKYFSQILSILFGFLMSQIISRVFLGIFGILLDIFFVV